jgi:hypothetical protein
MSGSDHSLLTRFVRLHESLPSSAGSWPSATAEQVSSCAPTPPDQPSDVGSHFLQVADDEAVQYAVAG